MFADASVVDLHLEKETSLLDVVERFLLDCLDCAGSMPARCDGLCDPVSSCCYMVQVSAILCETMHYNSKEKIRNV